MKKNQLILFTVLMLIIGFASRLIDPSVKDFNSQSLGMFIWLISPFILMLIFRAINKDWKSFGVKLHLKTSWPWYLISILLYPIVIGLILIIGKITNTITFENSLSLLPAAALVSLLPLFIKNIFEEFTWRGYLTPQMDKMGMSRFKNHLIVGIIWALWHLPFLDLMIRSYSQANLWIALPLMFIGIIITAFVYGEIRLRSSTVWTAVLLHAVGNAITNPLIGLNIIKLVSGKEFIASPTIDNIAYIVLVLIVAVVLFKLNSNIKTHVDAH